MARNLGPHRDAAVERLRWMLLAAVGGAAAACAGRSESPPGGDAGQNSGGTSASGGSAGTGTGGSSGGTGGSSGGTGGTSGTGGSVGGVGGSGGSVGGSGGTGVGGSNVGGAGGSVAGTAGAPEGCAAATSFSPTLEQCEGGFVHRPETGTCPQPERDGFAGGSGAPPVEGTCTADDDCDDQPNGYCVTEFAQVQFTYCIYSCSTDADCDAGQICSCEPNFERTATGDSVTLGICRGATCGTDGDCGADSLCISPVDAACGTARPSEFHCQLPEDECSGPADCTLAEYCTYADGRHVCQGRPVCGRPFLVDGSERLARLKSESGDDWLDGDLLGVPPEALGTADRRAIARYFADAGLMEHASIAAFARFALQLLALGAPSDLVEEATRAMADETRHARLCFGLSRRYGLAAGPGPLDMNGALGAVDLASVVELVVVEGCLGEATAALEAAWASEAATDPVVSHVLAGIATDEARHASLAFRFVGWACERDPRLRGLVARLVAEAAGRPDVVVGAATRSSAVREAHGVLSPTLRRAARRAALVGVIPTALDRLGIRSAARELDVA